VTESRASLAAFRVCSFHSNDCVMLFSEDKYDDDDDYLFTPIQLTYSVTRGHAHISLSLLLLNDSEKRHISGCGEPGVGPMIPNSNSGDIFVQCTLAAKFHHPMFNASEVIVMTNKQKRRR